MGLGKRVSVGATGVLLTFGAGYAIGGATARHPGIVEETTDQIKEDTGAEGGVGFRLPFTINGEPDPITGE